MAGAPALASGINSMMLFGYRRPWLRPRWRHVTLEAGRKILRIGIYFFMLQILVTCMNSSDNLIAAQILGPEAVTQFSISNRMFFALVLVMNMLVAPLWPAYGEALTRGEFAWVEKTFYRSLWILSVSVGLPSLILAFFGKPILHFWIGAELSPSFSLLLGLGVWTTMWSLGSAMAVILNAASIFRFQIVCTLLMFVSAVIAKIILARSFGLPGIVWGSVAVYSLLFILPYAFYISKLFSSMRQNQPVNKLA
jgi:O-antigen/teichoic acid export membrane protein